jgi:hypothetical protein
MISKSYCSLETAGASKMLEKDLEVRKIETTYSAMILGRHETHTGTFHTCPKHRQDVIVAQLACIPVVD